MSDTLPKALRIPVIAIDGGAATGKSSTAVGVADRLGFCYVDSGAIYRTIALALGKAGIEDSSDGRFETVLDTLEISVEPTPERFFVRLSGVEAGDEIRTPEVSTLSSRFAKHPRVRERVRGLVRSAAQIGPLVIEGRDIGTVVFPDAKLKVFLTASLETRAKRRLADLERQGETAKLESVRQELEERDERDSTRTESPLRRAEDAVLVDTSGMTLDAQVDTIVEIYRELPQ